MIVVKHMDLDSSTIQVINDISSFTTKELLEIDPKYRKYLIRKKILWRCHFEHFILKYLSNKKKALCYKKIQNKCMRNVLRVNRATELELLLSNLMFQNKPMYVYKGLNYINENYYYTNACIKCLLLAVFFFLVYETYSSLAFWIKSKRAFRLVVVKPMVSTSPLLDFKWNKTQYRYIILKQFEVKRWRLPLPLEINNNQFHSFSILPNCRQLLSSTRLHSLDRLGFFLVLLRFGENYSRDPVLVPPRHSDRHTRTWDAEWLAQQQHTVCTSIFASSDWDEPRHFALKCIDLRCRSTKKKIISPYHSSLSCLAFARKSDILLRPR